MAATEGPGSEREWQLQVMGMFAIYILQCIVQNKMAHVSIVFPNDELSCTCATTRWNARTLMLRGRLQGPYRDRPVCHCCL